jgi:F0F1-type ATP synthase assembly protein I
MIATEKKFKNINGIFMISAWSFTIVLSSVLSFFVGYWLDTKFNTEPGFMLGLFVLTLFIAIMRMYEDVWSRIKRS